MEINEFSQFMNLFRSKNGDIFITGFNEIIEGTISGIKFSDRTMGKY
jgi:hypothetical protein